MSTNLIDDEISKDTNITGVNISVEKLYSDISTTKEFTPNELDGTQMGEMEKEIIEETVQNEIEHESEWLDILGSGGIMKKQIIDGKPGTKPTRNEKCTINYTCSLEDGTVVDSAENFELFLGESDVSKKV